MTKLLGLCNLWIDQIKLKMELSRKVQSKKFPKYDKF